MSKKAHKPNAFMCFVNEWRADQVRAMPIHQAVERCGPIWQSMSDAERQPYKQNARNAKCAPGAKPAEKLTCLGVPISLAEKQRMEAEDKDRNMKRDIEGIVRQSVEDEQLADNIYYFCHVNYFIKSIGGEYLPAEIALIEFCLKSGVTRKYHTFVHPGNTTFGFQFEAQELSAKTHKLPLPPNAKGQRDLLNVYREVLEFINGHKPYDAKQSSKLPPIFTKASLIPSVDSSLKFLCLGCQEPVPLRIYSIEYLYYIMKVATAEAGEQDIPNSHYITDSYFERDMFEYEPNIACQFHEDEDRTKYCSLSTVVRWGYMFAEYMIRDLALIPKPGFHLPYTVNMAAIENTDYAHNSEQRINDAESVMSSKIDGSVASYRTEPIGSISGSLSNFSDESDFPVLCGRNKRGKPKQMPEQQLHDMNPWTSRDRRQPKSSSDANDFMSFDNADSNDINFPHMSRNPFNPCNRGRRGGSHANFGQKFN